MKWGASESVSDYRLDAPDAWDCECDNCIDCHKNNDHQWPELFDKCEFCADEYDAASESDRLEACEAKLGMI